jgi:RimJ/RimL family protein N-acetyltransferase
MKLTNIIIKKASLDDAANWASMLLQFDKETQFTMFQPNERSSDISKYENKIIEINNNPKAIILLAFDNKLPKDNVVGYLCGEGYKNTRKNHVVLIGVGVLKSYHSNGVGSQLLTELLKHARENGIKRIEAHIAESNNNSINLFNKFGFALEGKKHKAILIDNNYQDECLMALTY